MILWTGHGISSTNMCTWQNISLAQTPRNTLIEPPACSAHGDAGRLTISSVNASHRRQCLLPHDHAPASHPHPSGHLGQTELALRGSKSGGSISVVSCPSRSYARPNKKGGRGTGRVIDASIAIPLMTDTRSEGVVGGVIAMACSDAHADFSWG